MGDVGWRRAAWGATAALLMAIALTSCGDDGPGPDVAGPSRALFGRAWHIDSVSVAGTPVEVTAPSRASVRWEFRVDGGCTRALDCPDGPRLEGRDGCNDFTRAITVDGTTVAFGDWYWSTAVACGGPFADALAQLMGGDGFAYSIADDRLHLSSIPAGVELTFIAAEGPFGPPAGQIIADERVDGVAYRLVWTGVLQLQVAGADPDAFLSDGGSAGGDQSRINVLRGELGGATFLMGTLPPGVTRAVYEPSGRAPVELNVLRVADPDGLVFAEFVDAAPEAWDIVGYDDAGVELHRFGWLAGPATTISSASD
jgi:heat shock protein HslJ